MSVRIIQSVSELPDPSRIRTLYADAETISGDRKRGANKPYLGDRACGWGIAHDENPDGFYVPLRHSPNDNLFSKQYSNVDLDQFRRWMNDAMRSCREWVNHNIKFDGHFCEVDGIESADRMIDTLTMAKIVDGQRRGAEYGLKPLTKRWLGEDTDKRDAVDDELKRMKTKDFGAIDCDILGPYAVDDVHRNRRLWKEIQRRRYEGDEKIWEIEIGVTRALFNMERRPIYVDRDAMGEYRCRFSMDIERCMDEFDRLGFGSVKVSSDKALKDFVFGDLRLPKIAFNERGQPQINHAAIDAYLVHESVRNNPNLVEFFKQLLIFRERSQFISLYANGWEKWMDPNTGVMHPFYNQTVATGRMSCTSPNMQQLNSDAKVCIIPAPGMSIISRDYSQIEYRVIASFCGDERMISAYRDNPDTDFHQYVSDLCGIDRRPAKSVNFGIAFSMGLYGLIRQLRASLGDVSEDEAQQVLDDYNRRFPRVREVSKAIVDRAKGRAKWQDGEYGFIKTLYGRRRYLKFYRYREDKQERKLYNDETRLAFNSSVQGTAADMMKEGLVNMDRSEILRSAGVHPMAVVHDDFVGMGPTDAINDPEIQAEYERVMCNPSVDLGLPVIASGGESSRNWKEAG